MEELGELSNEILGSLQLQRETKLQKQTYQKLVDEWCDVWVTLRLLGLHLDIDIVSAIEEKFSMLSKRMDLSA